MKDDDTKIEFAIEGSWVAWLFFIVIMGLGVLTGYGIRYNQYPTRTDCAIMCVNKGCTETCPATIRSWKE